jgi:hypothetical protein
MMSNGEQAPAKKGLPIWAWIGIGCGALLILVLIVVMAAGFFVANKVKDVAGDFEDNPAMATARMIVKLNPELEEVSTDEEAGTITVRNKKTGEEVTVNFEDIEEGKLSFTTKEGEVTVDASELEDSGSLTVTNEDGGVVFSSGKASKQDIPDWVPVYQGTEPTNRHSMTAENHVSGGFEIETGDSVADVLEFYRAALEAGGFTVSVNTHAADNSEGGMVNGNHPEDQRSVIAIVSSEAGGPTKAMVQFSDEN